MKKIFNFRKVKMLFFFLCFLAVENKSSAQSAGATFVTQHQKKAVLLMKKTGIPASIILGVSMIESAMGKSKNCKLLNNYFGIKGKNNLHKGKSGHKSAYKQYPSAMASFKDFVRIIQKKKYYPALKGNLDYKKWLVKMNQHGYAEAKGKWIHDIEITVAKYDLDELDKVQYFYEDDNTLPIWGLDSTMMQLQED